MPDDDDNTGNTSDGGTGGTPAQSTEGPTQDSYVGETNAGAHPDGAGAVEASNSTPDADMKQEPSTSPNRESKEPSKEAPAAKPLKGLQGEELNVAVMELTQTESPEKLAVQLKELTPQQMEGLSDQALDKAGAALEANAMLNPLSKEAEQYNRIQDETMDRGSEPQQTMAVADNEKTQEGPTSKLTASEANVDTPGTNFAAMPELVAQQAGVEALTAAANQTPAGPDKGVSQGIA